MRKIAPVLLVLAAAMGLTGCGSDSTSGSIPFGVRYEGRWNVTSSWSDGRTDKTVWNLRRDMTVQLETGDLGTWEADWDSITIVLEAGALNYYGVIRDIFTMEGVIHSPSRSGTWKATWVGP